jgi:hypothetical protein
VFHYYNVHLVEMLKIQVLYEKAWCGKIHNIFSVYVSNVFLSLKFFVLQEVDNLNVK